MPRFSCIPFPLWVALCDLRCEMGRKTTNQPTIGTLNSKHSSRGVTLIFHVALVLTTLFKNILLQGKVGYLHIPRAITGNQVTLAIFALKCVFIDHCYMTAISLKVTFKTDQPITYSLSSSVFLRVNNSC